MGNSCTSALSAGGCDDKGGVLCFGHPLLDMIVTVDADFLKRYNLSVGSVVLAEPEQLSLFQHIVAEMSNVEYVPGGAAMNTARTIAWMRPDVNVSYVGALGNDNFAELLETSLSNAGVSPCFEVHSSKPTGTCACLVVEKERTLLANLGAAVELSRSFIESETVHQRIENASTYYAEGFFLNTASSPDGLLSVAKHAHAARKTFCFNLNAPYISVAFKDRVDLLMPYIDILFGSTDDIMSYAVAQWPEEFAKAASPTTKDSHINSSNSENAEGDCNPEPHIDETARLHTAVKRIADMPSARSRRMVIATCGAGNTVLGSSGDAVREFEVPPMAPEEIVDFNGAGDTFVGGFLAQYTLVKDEEASVSVAHATAQNCIRHNGAVVQGVAPALIHGYPAGKRSTL